MATGWLVLRDLAHYAPLVPVAAILWERFHHREPGDATVLLVGALFVSFLADQAGAVLPGNDWWLSYIFAPIQFALLAVAVSGKHPVRWLFVAWLLMLGGVSALRGPLDRPETIVQVAGGLFVAFLALGGVSRFRGAIWLYCLGTIPGLLWMAAFAPSDPFWLWGYGAYQGARLIGLGWVTAVVIGGEHGRHTGHHSGTGAHFRAKRRPPAGARRPEPATAFDPGETRGVA